MLQFLYVLIAFLHIACGRALPAQVQHNGRAVSLTVYKSLEELARIVDISYCVGTTGIQKPFQCLSRCSDFPGFELITAWNTGPLLSDSCGYIAISHAPFEKRVIVAFRGTYSIANTIVDLSTSAAQYAPFPDNNDENTLCPRNSATATKEPPLPQLLKHPSRQPAAEVCANCTVHSGFMSSWRNTRCTIIPDVEQALIDYPDYELVLVGHSLGGAVAALAALEFQARGWQPHVTTFGEPRIGNKELNAFIDRRFNLNSTAPDDALYRRVTHVNDPVPLLPLEEWGYTMHAGEIYITKSSTPPEPKDLRHCVGDDDPHCIQDDSVDESAVVPDAQDEMMHSSSGWVPARYKFWELFFAHRDYFLRLGLCVPPGAPWDWVKTKYVDNEMSHEL